mgnify:CR=1 FL=1
MGILAGAPDFVLLQELHSTPGTIYTSRKFMQQFDMPLTDVLMSIVPGRVGALRLKGPQGSLDIFVTYLSTGDARTERERQSAAFAAAIRPRSEVLSVIAGDCNLAADRLHRLTSGSM